MGSGKRLDVAVVGAGLTGLTAAARLSARGLSVALLEAAAEPGGTVATWRPPDALGRWIFELGPNTVVGGEPALGELIERAGLAGRTLTADRTSARRYLWTGDRLAALPAGPPGLLTTPLLGVGAKLRLLSEPLRRRGPGGETVAEFARRRLGPAALASFVEPFVSGIWAGDPNKLSLDHAFPRLAAIERRHRSLALGLRKTPAAGRRLLGIEGGFDRLPERLIGALRREQGDGAVRLSTPVDAIEPRQPGGLSVLAGGARWDAPQVILATPARATATLLAAASAGASRPLAEVPDAALAVVSLGFRREQVTHPLDGFGFLAPRGRGLRILGCLFPSTLFPGRAPAAHVALTVLIGGRTDPAAIELDDRELYARVLADLDRALGLRGDPVVAHLHRWPRAIPQYEIGHERYPRLAAELEAAIPGLVLAGSYMGGVSVPERVAAGARAAERAVGSLRTGASRSA